MRTNRRRHKRHEPIVTVGLGLALGGLLSIAGCPQPVTQDANSNTNDAAAASADPTTGTTSQQQPSTGAATTADTTTGSTTTGSTPSSTTATNTNANANTNSSATSANANSNSSTNSNTNANANANSNTNTNGTTTAGDIAPTADSITAAPGGARTDPEGVAAPASTSVVTWKDARHADRRLTLGSYLYQYDFSFDDGQQIVSRTANDDAWGHPGFGYVVSHNTLTGNSPLGKANTPTRVETRILTGGHHAIHRVEMLYDRDKEGGGMGIKIPVVIEWLVATGRDHPVWAVNWRAGNIQNPANVNLDNYRMDVRGPYGSLNYDGAATRAAGDAIGGVAWGDFGKRFTTTDAQLTLNSPWTYNTANSVCFSRSWTASTNAEMAIVQTRVGDKQMGYGDRVYGRERGVTSADMFLNRGDCSAAGEARNYKVPCVYGWPYQMMNYDWDAGNGKPANEATGTKLMAWGAPYGWLGASSFNLFDFSSTADGRGDRAYSTFIVLGPKGRYNTATGAYDLDGDAELTLRQVQSMAASSIGNVSVGSAVTQAPRGPGAAQTKTLIGGYDDTYSVFRVTAAGNAAAFTFTPAGPDPVRSPIFIVQNVTSRKLPTITVNGAPITVNTGNATSGAYVSIDEATNELWVTLNRTVAAPLQLSIAAQ